MEAFPIEPSERKVILVLDDHALEKCMYESGAGHIFNNQDVHVLQYPVRAHDGILALRNICENKNLARPGVILIQSPYNTDIYEDAENAEERFALAKYVYFSTFCKHLGAKGVRVEQIDIKSSTEEWSLDIEGKHLIRSGKMTVENSKTGMFRSAIELRDDFSGGEPDLVAAEQLLRQTGLSGDANMQSLLEMRRSSSNQIICRKLDLNLSSEAKRNLKIVGGIKVPVFFNIAIDYMSNVRTTGEYKLSVEVRF